MPPITDIVKHIIIINIIFFVGVYLPSELGYYDLTEWLRTNLALYFPASTMFMPFQIITHMFMHAGVSHIIFNMLSLFFLGPLVEHALGAKRFLLLYFAAGFAAMFLHQIIDLFPYIEMVNNLGSQELEVANTEGFKLLNNVRNGNNAGLTSMLQFEYILLQYVPMLGASGAVYGISVAFAVLFPDLKLQLMFIPIPIKAKHLILALVIMDVVRGLGNYNDNVAHFAHIGGAIAGFLITFYWKKKGLI